MNNFIKLSTIMLLLIFISNISLINISALDSEGSINISEKEKAKLCLNESKVIFEELIAENFSVQRVNDTLNDAENFYISQEILKSQNRNYNFSVVIDKCENIKDIRKNALNARDEIEALLKFYNESLTQEMNTSPADELISQIKFEMESERYENIKALTDKAYEEIVNIRTSYTALNLFYKTTTRSLKKFLTENWIIISVFLFILIIFYLIYRRTIRIWLIKRAMNNLSIRKETIKKLIKKTQRDYFDLGSIPEGEYNIKIKKFAEMVRDIDRQIPLLKEDLALIEKKNEKKKK